MYFHFSGLFSDNWYVEQSKNQIHMHNISIFKGDFTFFLIYIYFNFVSVKKYLTS